VASVHRRSLWLIFARRLHQGNRDLRFLTSRCFRLQPDDKSAALRAPAPLFHFTANTGATRPAADRPRVLERQPESQLFLEDAESFQTCQTTTAHRRIGVHRGHVVACGTITHSWPTGWVPGRGGIRSAGKERFRSVLRPRLGRGNGFAAPRRAGWQGGNSDCEEARSSSSRSACA
jgi:hypothetical protein